MLVCCLWSDCSAEEDAWLVAVVTVFIMASAVAVVVVILVYHETISNFLCLKDVLPLHFKEVCVCVSVYDVDDQKYQMPQTNYVIFTFHIYFFRFIDVFIYS